MGAITPKSSGYINPDTIPLITLAMVIILLISTVYGNKALSAHHENDLVAQRNVASIIQESVAAQRLMTCIMSVQQEKREEEYRNPNSFCHQMSDTHGVK